MQQTSLFPPAERTDRILLWVGSALLVLSSIVRVLGYPLFTSDYTYFVAKWFSALQSHPGLTAFQTPFADYAPLYLYLLKILTWIPVSSLYSSKTLSLLFDIAIAVYVVLLMRLAPRPVGRGALVFAFALIFSLPTVLINSSIWGQSDSVYAAGVVASLYYLLKGRPQWAAVAFGLALSVKVQAIFFLPVYVGWCLRERKHWLYLLVPPLVYAASIVPAWQGGGSYAMWFTMYLHQAGEYTGLSVSAQSIFAFVMYQPLPPALESVLFWAGLLAAAAVAVLVGGWVARTQFLTPERLLVASMLCAIALPYLLPRMHERYFYLADIFTVLFALWRPQFWYLPVAVVAASLISYMPFLYKQISWFSAFHVDLRVPSVLMLLVLAGFLAALWRARAPNRQAIL